MGEKNHPPTPQKIALARREGQVWRAALLVQTIGIIIFICIVGIYKTLVLEALYNLLELVSAGRMAVDRMAVEESIRLAVLMGVTFVFAALLVVAVVSSLISCAFGGFVMSAQTISPVFSRIEPGAGSVRVLSGLKDGWQIIFRLIISVSVFSLVAPHVSVTTNAPAAFRVVLVTAILVMLSLGMFDGWFKRRKFFLDQRMTDEELRRELRDNDGDPLLKAMQRSMHESLSRGEMISRLRRAKVLVVRRSKELTR